MYFFAKYIGPHKDSEKSDKIKRCYNNYEVCKHCKAKNKCYSSSQTHKIIIEYTSEMQQGTKWKNKNMKLNTPK